MKKIFIIGLTGWLMITGGMMASAAKFKDVPENHWASEYVYDLVNRGVTSGYPDGTFRGDQKITRYETAVFLSKLANSLNGAGISEAKVRELIRNEMAKAASGKSEGWSIAGTYSVRGLLNKVIGDNTRSIAGQYRMQMKIAKDLGPDAGFEIGWDTRTYASDWMSFGSHDIFASGMFDWAANATISDLWIPLDIYTSQGNGDQFHKEDRIQVTTDLSGIRVGAAYEYNNGLIADVSNQYSLLAGCSADLPFIGATSCNGSFDFFVPTTTVSPWAADGKKKAELSIVAIPDDGIKLSSKLGFNGTTSNAWALSGMLTLDDYWNTGTVFYLEAYKLGGSWQTDLGEDYFGVKVFEENLVTGNSQAYIGAKLDQTINDKWLLGARLEMDFSGEGLGTLQTTIVEPKLTLKSSDLLSAYGAYRYTLTHTTNAKSDRLEVGALLSF